MARSEQRITAWSSVRNDIDFPWQWVYLNYKWPPLGSDMYNEGDSAWYGTIQANHGHNFNEIWWRIGIEIKIITLSEVCRFIVSMFDCGRTNSAVFNFFVISSSRSQAQRPLGTGIVRRNNVTKHWEQHAKSLAIPPPYSTFLEE